MDRISVVGSGFFKVRILHNPVGRKGNKMDPKSYLCIVNEATKTA